MNRYVVITFGLVLSIAASVVAQNVAPERYRALREKSRNGTLTAEEQKELDAAAAGRSGGGPAPGGERPTGTRPTSRPTATGDRPTTRPTTRPMPTGTRPTSRPTGTGERPTTRPMPTGTRPTARPTATGDRADMARDPAALAKRRESYLQRQAESHERMRQLGAEAVKAAEARQAPNGPNREFYVNNEIGSDDANGLSAEQGSKGGPVRTLAKAASLLLPGDTLHLAVTNEPYHETLTLGDNFGGVPGRPITIDGHGATITGCDPLRWDSWQSVGEGLYKSDKFIDELQEFDDGSKLGRVYLVFDGVAQHMGRSMKGKKANFKSPSDLQAGEWTFVESERTFYLKIAGSKESAKVEAPYRRNGLTVRAPKVAATNVVIKNLIVCRVLNDGFNFHGSSRNFLLENIAAIECGDDGLSPHETNEVEIDGFWSVGNSTGMGNGFLSKTVARNVRLEANLGHQLMTGHAPSTHLTNAIIIAIPGTEPINVTNSQDTKLVMENVIIGSPAGQKVLLIAKSATEGKRLTVFGPNWEVAGAAKISDSVIGGGSIAMLDGGEWSGGKNVFDSASSPPNGDAGSSVQSISENVLTATKSPFPGAGANRAEMKIPPKPKPHPKAGKFVTLDEVVE